MKTTKKANNEANIAYNEAIRYVENAIEILKKKQEKKAQFHNVGKISLSKQFF